VQRSLRRRLLRLRAVQFCESCTEVSTPQSRGQARLDAAHTRANLQQYLTIR
jgi:hypothetical protein